MKRFGWVLLILGVLAALVVGAEFGVRALVQQQAQQALGNTEFDLRNPTMTLGGGSVLAAVAQGRFVDVSGTADGATLPVDGRQVPVRAITYRAKDIRLASTSEAVIGTAELRGTLAWADASELAGLPLAHGGDDRLLVTYTVTVLNLNALKVGVSAVPALDVPAQQIELREARIDVAGVELTESLSQQILDRAVRPIPLDAGEGVRVTGVQATADGLVADLTATDVPVRR